MNLGAGPRRLSLSLADRKILIQRVYRRACAGHIEAPADHGLATQASATAGRGTRARRWGGRKPPIYPLDNEILAAKASLLSLFSLFPTGQIILLNSKNL